MTKPQHRRPFIGIDGRDTPPDVPAWYRTKLDVPTTNPPTFMDRVGDLPTATKTKAGYYDPDADEWVEAEHFQAVVNPDWLGHAGRQNAPKPDAAWYIPTVGYDIVNPMDAYGPLTATLRARGHMGVYGEVRTYRNGGEVHLDLFVPDLTTRVEGSEFTFGVTTGYDHYTQTKLYSRPIALAHDTQTVLRHIAPKQSRRHVKSRSQSASGSTAKDVADWWVSELERLDAATDALLAVVADARAYEIEPTAYDAEQFYVAQGLPETYAEQAADRLDRGLPATAHALYLAGAATIEEDFDGKDDGAALKRHLTAVNRILFEPAVAESTALQDAAERLKNQQTLDADAMEDVHDRHESLAAARDQTKSMRSRMADLVDAAGDIDTEADA